MTAYPAATTCANEECGSNPAAPESGFSTATIAVTLTNDTAVASAVPAASRRGEPRLRRSPRIRQGYGRRGHQSSSGSRCQHSTALTQHS